MAFVALMSSASADVDCIVTPQNETCTNYTFPSSTGIVVDFCDMMDNMPGCTIYHICQDSTYNTSDVSSGVCTHFSLAADLCFDMPGMDSRTCGQLASMCASGSVVAECQTANLTSTMPTYSQLTAALTSVCSNDTKPSDELCSRCSASNGWNCDLLSTFTAICAVDPTLEQCSLTQAFCTGISAYNWPICIANPPFAPISGPSSMNMPGMEMPPTSPASPAAPSAIPRAEEPSAPTPSAATISVPAFFGVIFAMAFAAML